MEYQTPPPTSSLTPQQTQQKTKASQVQQTAPTRKLPPRRAARREITPERRDIDNKGIASGSNQQSITHEDGASNQPAPDQPGPSNYISHTTTPLLITQVHSQESVAASPQTNISQLNQNNMPYIEAHPDRNVPPQNTAELTTQADTTAQNRTRHHLINLYEQCTNERSKHCLQELMEINSEDDHRTLLEKTDEWMKSYFKRRPLKKGTTQNRNQKPHQPRAYGQSFTGRGARAANYKKTQDLNVKNRKSLVDQILRGRQPGDKERMPSLATFHDFLRRTVGAPPQPNPTATENTSTIPNQPTKDILGPITPEEVEAAKEKWALSATGPDGITVATVKTTDNTTLAALYTLCLAAN